MLTQILFITASFLILYFGARLLIHGASSIAVNLGVSKVVVGVTLVAFGTSSPEFIVNVVAAYRDHTGFALTNIAGSNLTNLCIGFGICALLGGLVVDRIKFKIDLWFFFGTPLLLLMFFLVGPGMNLSRLAGIPFAILFIVYLLTLRGRLKAGRIENNGTPGPRLLPGVFCFLAGCATLYGGGELVLYGSINIAKLLGISDTIIGLTIVAVGTSIPDVMASIIAFRKRETSIAVGNLLGSNIFNILLVLGGTLLVSWRDLAAEGKILTDYVLVCATSTVFFLFVLLSPRIRKIGGAALISVYIGYMVFRVATA